MLGLYNLPSIFYHFSNLFNYYNDFFIALNSLPKLTPIKIFLPFVTEILTFLSKVADVNGARNLLLSDLNFAIIRYFIERLIFGYFEATASHTDDIYIFSLYTFRYQYHVKIERDKMSSKLSRNTN